jgi:hypothetical protein
MTMTDISPCIKFLLNSLSLNDFPELRITSHYLGIHPKLTIKALGGYFSELNRISISDIEGENNAILALFHETCHYYQYQKGMLKNHYIWRGKEFPSNYNHNSPWEKHARRLTKWLIIKFNHENPKNLIKI